MENNKRKIDRKALLKKLSSLNDRRSKDIFSLVQEEPMVLGLPHVVFRKCGKPNCRCALGELHGPYNALSVNKDGRQKIVMVKKADAGTVMKKSRRYRHFQRTLARIRKVNREIDEIMEQIRSAVTENYP